MASQTVRAADSRALIRHALRKGGSAAIEFGARRRVLLHDPRVDKPANPLPWPLSLFQTQTVRYVVTEGGKRISSHMYVLQKADEAIDYFLRDIDPQTEVTITRPE